MGVIIGGAFGLIVKSLVNDIIMPLVGVLIGGIDISKMAVKVGTATVAYGSFLQTIINFLIITFSIFIMVKVFNKINKKRVEETNTEKYLKQITEILEKK